MLENDLIYFILAASFPVLDSNACIAFGFDPCEKKKKKPDFPKMTNIRLTDFENNFVIQTDVDRCNNVDRYCMIFCSIRTADSKLLP